MFEAQCPRSLAQVEEVRPVSQPSVPMSTCPSPVSPCHLAQMEEVSPAGDRQGWGWDRGSRDSSSTWEQGRGHTGNRVGHGGTYGGQWDTALEWDIWTQR